MHLSGTTTTVLIAILIVFISGIVLVSFVRPKQAVIPSITPDTYGIYIQHEGEVDMDDDVTDYSYE
jgi:hypothetical protein